MPGTHKQSTIAFRPSSSWQAALINERCKLSGMNKKDFICRSIIYSNICVVGKKETVQVVVDSLQEMEYALKEIVSQLETGGFFLSEAGYEDLKNDLHALCVTCVDMLNGAELVFLRISRTCDKFLNC